MSVKCFSSGLPLQRAAIPRGHHSVRHHSWSLRGIVLSICWWRSIVVRLLVLAGELSLFCAKLMDGRVATLWVKLLLSVNQQGHISLPSFRVG